MKPNNAITLGAVLSVILATVILAFTLWQSWEWISWDLWDIIYYSLSTFGIISVGIGTIGVLVPNKNRAIFGIFLAMGLAALLSLFFMFWW